jgi:lipopolysaccharide transport system ATP-binding protein
MRRAEIAEKLDSIVDFAGVRAFLDVPVKRFSSGMYVRLGFSIASHLDPDILLLDEVLAVGDAAFQKKCLGRMTDVARSGRTVLFVSHNMTAVQSLCHRAIWLRHGRIACIGTAASAISEYLAESAVQETDRLWPDIARAPGNDAVRLHRARIVCDGRPGEPLSVRTPFGIEIDYWNMRDGARLALSIHLHTELGVLIFSAGLPQEEVFGGEPMPAALFRDRCDIPGDLLNDGVHRVELYVMRGPEVVYHDPDLLLFEVADSTHRRGAWYGKWPGAIRPKLPWTTELVATLSGAPR